MSGRTTPLGFLPGDIDLHSHCMFIYGRKGETFVRNIIDFLSAGLNAGEMCVCALRDPVLGRIRDRMVELGAEPTSTPGEEQLCILDAAYVYTPDGCWDRRYTMRFWQERLEIAGRRYNGLRAFGDCSRLARGRVARLKLLEYEALVNLGCAANIALCGYGSSGATRSFLQQAKSVHPFIASSRSVQRNHLFVETSKFLGGLYRFRRVSRVYPADAGRAREARRDLEEIAARTPLAIPEIEEMKVAMSEAFVNAIEHGCRSVPPEASHVHVVFAPKPDRMLVTVRDHGPGFDPVDFDTDPDDVRRRGVFLMRELMDEVRVERRRGDTVVAMEKKYSAPISLHA